MADSRLDNSAASQCLVDGKPADTLSVLDRGLSYGDGVFETMRVAKGRIALLDYHLVRLRRGLGVLRMSADLADVVAELGAVAEQLQNGVIKLTLTRGRGQRGYAIPYPARATRICQSFAPVSYPPENAREGISLYPCETRLAVQPLLAGIKHLNRLEQVLARSEWSEPTYAEGLVRDTQGNVVECTVSNLFLLHEDHWVTPDLQYCGVQGVMRDYLIDQMQSSGQRVEVRRVGVATLRESTEVFCCNSLFGVWPVTALGDASWSIGPRTRQAQALAEQVIM
ncbi:aminodeoxychorismate lyase [Halopseudomonas sp.]|uniref:aminodeoxychorismate lyase n=1 Tax=Halopseudomonas sp. TaxID=2901191 RepID=UPI0035668141